MAEAENIKQHVERLNEAITGKSGNIGFDPVADLETYALLLHSQRNDTGAKRIRILARKWFFNNAMAAGFPYETLVKSQQGGN